MMAEGTRSITNTGFEPKVTNINSSADLYDWLRI